jgi:hypothetical protein
MNVVQEEHIGTADQRLNLRAPLIIQKVHLDEERSVFFGYTKNISCSGMFIATTHATEPGTRLSLEIPLPAPLNNVIRCECEVVWKRPFGKHLPFEPGIGIKFIDLPADVAAQIDDWAKQHQ